LQKSASKSVRVVPSYGNTAMDEHLDGARYATAVLRLFIILKSGKYAARADK